MFRRNLELAAALERLALFLELDGADKFRTRAYTRAARSVGAAPFDVLDHVRSGGDPCTLAGIGPRIGALVREYAASSRIARLQELEARYPPGLLELMRVPRLGADRIRRLHERLGIRDLADLRRAAEAGQLSSIRGIGKRVESEVLHGLETFGAELPFRRADVMRILPEIVDRFRSLPGVEDVLVAGALRRRREVISEVEIVLVLQEPLALDLAPLTGWAAVLDQGDRRATIRLSSGLRVSLVAADPSSRGAALLVQTGSPGHVEKLRARAADRGQALDSRAGDEEQIFDALELPFIEPELREDRGELEAAAERALPTLIRLEDLKGDLHSHTDETDGRDSLERMADAAAEKGLRYLAVTDHTKSLKITNGQDERRLALQMARIDRLNGKLRGLTLLKGAEVDILEDGRLDLSDDILKDLDLTVCSVHSKFTLDPKAQTERVLRALEHPSFRILGHPTGRLLLRRKGHPLDVQRLIQAAKDLGRILELNSQPDRLDLDDLACRRARESGVLVAISSDSHSIGELHNLRWGVDQARRAWLEPKDVVNTRDLPELLNLLARR